MGSGEKTAKEKQTVNIPFSICSHHSFYFHHNYVTDQLIVAAWGVSFRWPVEMASCNLLLIYSTALQHTAPSCMCNRI